MVLASCCCAMPACCVLTLHTWLLDCSVTLQGRAAGVRLTVLMPCLCAAEPIPESSSTAVRSTATASAGRRMHARQAEDSSS
jgi:hypothetical protein